MYNICNYCKHENDCIYKDKLMELKTLEYTYSFVEINCKYFETTILEFNEGITVKPKTKYLYT